MNHHPRIHRHRRALTTPLLFAATLLLLTTLSAHAAEHSLGLGAHFFRTIDSVSDVNGIDEDGNSWLLSYQYKPRGLFRLELDLEYFPDSFSGALENAFAPQAFVLIGHGLYGGIGAGKTFSSDLVNDSTDIYYMARFGWELAILGAIGLDLQATYLFDNWDAVRDFDIDSDTLTLGAVLRFNL